MRGSTLLTADYIVRNFLLLLTLTLAAAPAAAQSAYAELSGTVTSEDGIALRSVAVNARHSGTGSRRNAVTTDTGAYGIAGLKPGTYIVTFALPGFTTHQRHGVELRLGRTTDLPVILQVASIAETVNVTASPQLVDLQSVQVGDTLTSDEFIDLPTQNRSFVLFAGILPGVIPNPQTDSSSSDALYINGQHQANNSFGVDGAKNNDPVVGSFAGAQVRTPIEAIQEFQVVTVQPDAEFGGATGGVLNALTRSGTNQIKGSAFAFFQKAAWNSRSFFTERLGLTRPDASFESAGFTLGGPILRDQLHYFLSFEHTRDQEGHTRFFTSRPELSYATTEDNQIRNVLGRVDYQLARNHHWSFRYLAEKAPQRNKIVGSQTTLEGAREEHDHDFNAISRLETVATDHFFNSLILSYNHEEFVNAASPFGHQARDFASLRAFSPLLARPSVDEGTDILGRDQMDESVDIGETASLFIGNHDLRAGFQWARRAFRLVNFDTANGRFQFDTDRPFDLGDISTYPVAFTVRIRGAAVGESADHDTLGLFVQDQWRVRNHLTLSLGLRWDRDDTVNDNDNFAPRIGFAWSPRWSGRTVVRGAFGRFYDQVRLGSWAQSLLDGVRLTEGLNVRAPDAGQNRQFFYDLVRANGITSLVQLRDLLARNLEEQTSTQLNPAPTVDHGDRVQPYVDSFTFGAQHELWSSFAVGIDVVVTESRKTLVLVELNPFSRSRGGRPNISILDGQVVNMGSISTLLNAGHNRYSAVQFSLRKRMGSAFGGRVSYTYADSEGNYGNAGPLGAPNTAYFQTRSETGYNFDTAEIIGEPLQLNLEDSPNEGQPVGWQRRHHLVVAGVWRLPRSSWHGDGGLTLSWLYRYMSGDRFTIFTTELLDNGNRAPAAAGTYDAGVDSDIAQNDVPFSGTFFGAENPDFSRLDLSARYSIPLPLRETRLTLIGEVFNATDRVNFVNSGGALAGTAGFLTPTSTFSPREFQLGARLSF